jgi:2-dehydro-3-deoxyphosphooctonate aldolase (KDO 8-P synthase)
VRPFDGRAEPFKSEMPVAVPGEAVSGQPTTEAVRIGALTIGGGAPLALIGGPCAIENEKHALMTAERLATIAADRRVPFVYKSSYDKANRSSINGYRGPGLREGLRILRKVRDTLSVPVLSDVHQVSEVAPAAEVLDVLQIPAFLCRQTDLVLAVAQTGKPVNVKKGQFLAAGDMKNVVDKILSVGNRSILLTERGTSFGYHNLVVDLRGLADMQALGFPVVFDATHSVQLPGGAGDRSGGERKYVPALARAAVAFGVDALFMEMHEDPDRTLPDGRPLSDGPNMLRIDDLPRLLRQLHAIEAAVQP